MPKYALQESVTPQVKFANDFFMGRRKPEAVMRQEGETGLYYDFQDFLHAVVDLRDDLQSISNRGVLSSEGRFISQNHNHKEGLARRRASDISLVDEWNAKVAEFKEVAALWIKKLNRALTKKELSKDGPITREWISENIDLLKQIFDQIQPEELRTAVQQLQDEAVIVKSHLSDEGEEIATHLKNSLIDERGLVIEKIHQYLLHAVDVPTVLTEVPVKRRRAAA